MNEKEQFSYDTINIILFLKKKFKPIVIFTVLGAIVSIIASFLIEPKFKSNVILFPAPSVSISKSLLLDNVNMKSGSKYGEEEEVEQLLQVLNSDDIRDLVIEKYDLMNHYQIDSNSRFPKTKLYKAYETNISCNKTKYMSVEIEVLDKDPKTAAAIANDIANFLDTVMNRMEYKRARKSYEIVLAEYNSVINQVRELEDSLRTLRELGINDYESQAERYSEYYAKALIEGNTKHIKFLEEKISILSKYGGAYVAMRDMLEYETGRVAYLKRKVAEAKVELNQTLPHKFVVNQARVPEKKSKPIRWLIVVMGTLSTFLLVIFAFLISDYIKSMLKTLPEKSKK